jgi:hypothetical protein
MFSILSASLLLGDLNFKPTGSNDAAQIINMDVLKKVAGLLSVPADELGAALVSEVNITRGGLLIEARGTASNSAYYGYPELWILRYPAQRYHAVPSPGFEPMTLVESPTS